MEEAQAIRAAMKKVTDEQFADLFFPERGFNDSVSLSDMPPGFTPLGENVRVYEALTGRGRGGSRSGLDKFVGTQVSGNHEIQHLATIVSVDASLVGWIGNDGDQGFPGTYGGVGFIEPIGGGGFGNPGTPGGFDPFPAQWLSGQGGGGFQPNGTTTRLITVGARVVVDGVTAINRMASSRPLRLRLPSGHPSGIVVWLRITNQDGRTGDYEGFENVTLYTFPNGEVGDTEPVSMEFDTADPPDGGRLGLGEYEVYSTTGPKEVVYYAITYAIAGAQFRSRHPVIITWDPDGQVIPDEPDTGIPISGGPITAYSRVDWLHFSLFGGTTSGIVADSTQFVLSYTSTQASEDPVPQPHTGAITGEGVVPDESWQLNFASLIGTLSSTLEAGTTDLTLTGGYPDPITLYSSFFFQHTKTTILSATEYFAVTLTVKSEPF